MSQRGRWLFFLGMFLLTVGIASGFALMGLWLILPFAGFEMLVLAGVLYAMDIRARRYESIAIHSERIDIVRNDGIAEETFTFQRYWARAQVLPAGQGGRERLMIHSHGSGVEVGGFLDEQERRTLASEFSRLLSEMPRPVS